MKKKRERYLEWNYTEIRRCLIDNFRQCTISLRNTPLLNGVVLVQLMTLGTFQAVKFGGSKGGQGRVGAEAGCRALDRGRTVVASGAERAGNIDHAAITVNHSKARRTRQMVDTGHALANFASIPYWRTALSRSFGRSEGNGTSQLLVYIVHAVPRYQGFLEASFC